MSSLIPGALIITTFLAVSVIVMGTFLGTSTIQTESLKDLGKTQRERAGSLISIASAGVSGSEPGVGTDITLLVENTGSQSVSNFSQMDVIIQYTDPDNNPVRRYLAYSPDGLSDNQWTIPEGGITPDALNPGMWDPDETLTIELRVAPEMMEGTSAVVTLATPRAAGAQTTVSN